MRWLKRTELAKAATVPPAGALIFAGDPAEGGVPLAGIDIDAMQALSRRSFERTGLAKRDRVLFAVRRDGAPSVELLAQAVAPSVASVAVTGPKGRLRLLATIRALKPNVLVTTPCGAADLLARLYLEFNVDPVELDLGKIILVGEIASPGVRKRIAKEFESDLSDIYCDPVFGAALASRRGGAWELADETSLALAELGQDEIRAEGVAGEGELALRPSWSGALGDVTIRTGQVITGVPSDAGLFNRTVGDHVLIRGQWVSLALLRRQLGLIDGISAWTLTIDRGDRTLDNATLTVSFDRETLVDNPMWKGRIGQALSAVTPIHVDVATIFAAEPPLAKETVVDLRGHHLAIDRKMAAL